MPEVRTKSHSQLDVIEVNAEFTVASHQSVLIVIWRASPTMAAFQQIDGYTSSFAHEQARRIALLIVIEASSDKPPSQQARQENVRLSRKYEDVIAANATVLEGSSVKHSMFRFILSTIQLMSPSKIPHATFENATAAAVWISKSVEDVSSSALCASLAEARSIGVPVVSTGTPHRPMFGDSRR